MNTKIVKMKGLALAAVLGVVSCQVQAELAVVVQKASPIGNMDADAVAAIFLGKTDSAPDGTKVLAVDQKEGRPARDEFYSKVIRKDTDQVDAYWARMIFTGKGEPPKKLPGNADVIAMVAANPNVVGYVDAAAVTDAVKVVAKVP